MRLNPYSLVACILDSFPWNAIKHTNCPFSSALEMTLWQDCLAYFPPNICETNIHKYSTSSNTGWVHSIIPQACSTALNSVSYVYCTCVWKQKNMAYLAFLQFALPVQVCMPVPHVEQQHHTCSASLGYGAHVRRDACVVPVQEQGARKLCAKG